MFISKVFIIYFCVLCMSFASEKNSNEVRLEIHDIEALEQATRCDFRNVILINIFKGYLAVPNSFYIDNIRGGMGDGFLFRSGLKKGNYKGRIQFGFYDDKKLDGLRAIDPRIHFSEFDAYKEYEIDVLVKKFKTPGVYGFLLYKDGEYLYIVDQSYKLVKEILPTFKKIKECK